MITTNGEPRFLQIAGWPCVQTETDDGGGLTTVRWLAKYQRMTLVFKALADPTRRRVLQLLRERPMTAGELSEHFAVSKPTMSAHFAVLQQADLVEAEKSGRTIVYRLKMSVLEDALLGFAHSLGWEIGSASARLPARRRRPTRTLAEES